MTKLSILKDRFNKLQSKREKELERVDRKDNERHEKTLEKERNAETKTRMKFNKINEKYDVLLDNIRESYNRESSKEEDKKALKYIRIRNKSNRKA